MNGLEFLDLVIGLIFIYLIYSICASAIWEMLANMAHLRGKMLRKWIMENFANLQSTSGQQSNQILEHPFIKGASGKANGRPSYISSKVFSDVIVDLIFKADKSITDLSKIKLEINSFRESLVNTKVIPEGLQGIFLQYTDETATNLQKVKDKIGTWYDEAQERLLGSYKKHLQRWILVISVFLVGSTNADTIKIISYLYNNDSARETIAIKASTFVQDSSIVMLNNKIKAYYKDTSSAKKTDVSGIVKTLDEDLKLIKSLKNELDNAAIPLGWGIEDLDKYDTMDYIIKFFGLLLTALAVSMGSPFWFDILSKLSNLRAAGNKPKTVSEQKVEKEIKTNE